jgi:hypothetical protein
MVDLDSRSYPIIEFHRHVSYMASHSRHIIINGDFRIPAATDQDSVEIKNKSFDVKKLIKKKRDRYGSTVFPVFLRTSRETFNWQ